MSKQHSDQLEPYKKVQHIRASCGDISNPFFMDHLKMLLSLSTSVVSNLVNTSILYAAYLGKNFGLVGEKNILKEIIKL